VVRRAPASADPVADLGKADAVLAAVEAAELELRARMNTQRRREARALGGVIPLGAAHQERAQALL
jgi:hypothetical protein